MVTTQQVLYIEFLKNTYGKDLKEAMLNQLTPHAEAVLNESIHFGLLPQTEIDFYTAFEKKGGDSDYLQFATQVFLQVRQQLLQHSRS